MSEAIIQTAKVVRTLGIQQIGAIPEECFDIQPAAFSNTIRWNVGHMATSLAFFLSKGLPFNSRLPENYAALFQSGTRPSEWQMTPPTKAELIHRLSAQLVAIDEISPSALDRRLDPAVAFGPLRFKSVGEVVNFAVIHETIHLTTIGNLFKVIQADR